MTVVGDDAQSIYSFRAATVRNILEFPTSFSPAATSSRWNNYRSTAPILAAANAGCGSPERFAKGALDLAAIEAEAASGDREG